MNKLRVADIKNAVLVFILVAGFNFVSNAAASADPTTQWGTLIGSVYNLIYPVAIIYGIFEIIFAGYRIMKSEGEPAALKDAQEHLTNSVMGIIFVILALVILKVIIKAFLGQPV